MTSRVLWNQTAIDFAVLATAMLPAMKAQTRVTFDRDDALLVQKTASAISVVEKRANIDLHPATYRTAGTFAASCGGPCVCPMGGALGYRLPFNNVRALRLFDAAGDAVTGDWEIVQAKFGSNAEAYAVSPSNAAPPGSGAIEIDVGVDDFALLDPAVVEAVQRYAASAYEHREAILPLADSGFDPELIAIWRPAA